MLFSNSHFYVVMDVFAVKYLMPLLSCAIKTEPAVSGDGSNAASEPQCFRPDRNSEMREYEIVDTHADNIGGCGICGRQPGRIEGYHCKCD